MHSCNANSRNKHTLIFFYLFLPFSYENKWRNECIWGDKLVYKLYTYFYINGIWYELLYDLHNENRFYFFLFQKKIVHTRLHTQLWCYTTYFFFRCLLTVHTKSNCSFISNCQRILHLFFFLSRYIEKPAIFFFLYKIREINKRNKYLNIDLPLSSTHANIYQYKR